MIAAGPTASAPTAGPDTPLGSASFAIAGVATATFYNSASYTSGVFHAAGGSAALFTGNSSQTQTYYEYVFENMAAGDNVVPPVPKFTYGPSIAENAYFGTAMTLKELARMTQGVTLGASQSYIWTAGATILEVAKISGLPGVAMRMTVVMSDRLKFAQKQTVGILTHLQEQMHLGTLAEAYIGSIVFNKFAILDTFSPKLVYRMAKAEAFRLAGVFLDFAGLSLIEHVTLEDVNSAAYSAVAELVDFLTVQAGQTSKMAFRLTMPNGFNVSDADVLRMIYQGDLLEDMTVNVLYQSPGGATTAFAINTRTGAVTEYDNFNFNSFATIGRKYIAAASDGLYELNGPTDNGLATVSDIMGGFFQPAGGHLAGLKGVYLGQSGTGYWLLKLETGDGREYVYQRLSNPGLMTTKFNIGKGINARYIGWELTNVEGQDFDIESIEFVPMVRQRRI